jgi:transposase
MSRTPDSPSRRPRQQFDDDYKGQAVRLVLDEGKTVGSVARDLDLTETALREWVNRARADRTGGKTGLTTTEREELARLRKENRVLAGEREILKKAAPSSRTSAGEVSLHRGGEGAPPALHPVPLHARNAQRLLRVAAAARIGPGTS